MNGTELSRDQTLIKIMVNTQDFVDAVKLARDAGNRLTHELGRARLFGYTIEAVKKVDCHHVHNLRFILNQEPMKPLDSIEHNRNTDWVDRVGKEQEGGSQVTSFVFKIKYHRDGEYFDHPVLDPKLPPSGEWDKKLLSMWCESNNMCEVVTLGLVYIFESLLRRNQLLRVKSKSLGMCDVIAARRWQAVAVMGTDIIHIPLNPRSPDRPAQTQTIMANPSGGAVHAFCGLELKSLEGKGSGTLFIDATSRQLYPFRPLADEHVTIFSSTSIPPEYTAYGFDTQCHEDHVPQFSTSQDGQESMKMKLNDLLGGNFFGNPEVFLLGEVLSRELSDILDTRVDVTNGAIDPRRQP